MHSVTLAATTAPDGHFGGILDGIYYVSKRKRVLLGVEAVNERDTRPQRQQRGSGQSALTYCRLLCHSDMVCFICRHLMQRIITINLEGE